MVTPSFILHIELTSLGRLAGQGGPKIYLSSLQGSGVVEVLLLYPVVELELWTQILKPMKLELHLLSHLSSSSQVSERQKFEPIFHTLVY